MDFGRFDAITFDCYGTLIDWETGLLTALRPIADRHGVQAADERLLELYGRHEAAAEAVYQPYRDVVAAALRRALGELGAVPSDGEAAGFAAAVADWPAFDDSVAALARLKERFRLGVITNCDDDLFAASNARLAVEFDWVVTAQQARAYKPSLRPFEVAFERIDVPRERILHVAQSLFHDHVPAAQLGLTSVWIDRRAGREGAGATPPAQAQPAATFPDLASFAAAATAPA